MYRNNVNILLVVLFLLSSMMIYSSQIKQEDQKGMKVQIRSDANVTLLMDWTSDGKEFMKAAFDSDDDKVKKMYFFLQKIDVVKQVPILL